MDNGRNVVDRRALSLASGFVTEGESLTVQSEEADANINVIMDRYGFGAKLPENFRAPQYGDFSEVQDYQSCLNAVKAADAAFMEMPADVRERFGNSPQQLLEFLADGRNLDEARKLGLARAAEVVQPGESAVSGGSAASGVAASSG